MYIISDANSIMYIIPYIYYRTMGGLLHAFLHKIYKSVH